MNRDRLTRRSTLTLLAGSALTLPLMVGGRAGAALAGPALMPVLAEQGWIPALAVRASMA